MVEEKNSQSIDKKQWIIWMELVQNGDKTAYKELLTKSEVLVRNFLRKKLQHNSPHLEDIVQEVLMALHKAKHTFDLSRPYTNWLYTIARYKYVDYLRKWSKTEKYEVYSDFDFDSFLATEELKLELDDDLENAISSLPKKQRETVEMINLKGMSISEVSKQTGSTETAIRVSAHRAYKRLKKILTGKS